MLDESRLEELSRLAAGVTTRRLALGVAAAAGGLALAGNAEAKKDEAHSERWRRRRGRRGRRGKKGPEGPNGPSGPSGPTGPDGPPAGASIIVERQTCSFPDGTPPGSDGATDGCTASCPSGYVATGGGYEGTSVTTFARVRSTYPDLNGDDVPVGWTTVVEFITTPWTFEVTTYVICVPE
ncbi:MAG: hypothetical protein U0075_19545 [Thermomicrobiales bacterium]